MRILITGAGGFVGSRARRLLTGAGHDIIGVDVPSTAAQADGLIAADLARPNGLDAVGGQPIDAVIHCASQQPRTEATWEDYYRGNVVLLQHVLDWMGQRETPRIVTFSTAVVYGHTALPVLDESSPVQPNNFYAISKLMAEHLLRYRCHAEGLHGICFRMPSVYGPGQIGGLVHTYYQHAKERKPLALFQQGRLQKNLLHVDDVVRACALALENNERREPFGLYLLGSANSMTTRGIAEYIFRRLEVSTPVTGVDQASQADIDWVFCLDRVRAALRFEPRPLEAGLDQYLAEMERAHG